MNDSVSKFVDHALKLVQDLNGHFRVEVSGRDLLLTIYPASGTGVPVDETTIYQELMSYEPETIDESDLTRLVKEADAKRHVIGRLSHEGERDAQFRVDVADDAMSARITLVPPKKGGREMSVDIILKGMAAKGVVFGIDRGAIESALARRAWQTPITVAAGKPPEEGDRGRIGFTFRTDKHVIHFKENEQGRVDYRELELIESVKAGQVLAERIPPGKGEPGRNVRGEIIPASPGPPAAMPEGVNVYTVENELKASLDGSVTLVDGKVIVSPVYHVAGDVNYEIGNIDFDGTVRVDGLIEDVFSVKARGSLFVKKSIGKCRIDVSGNVVVMGGILGRSEAEIMVGGDLVALFIGNSKVTVGKNLIVGEMIMHSDVSVGGNFSMTGGRAALVGGTVTVAGDITVRTIGGEATRTVVRAGVNPALLKTLSDQRAESILLEEKLTKIHDALRRIEARAEDSVEVEGEKIELLRSSHSQLRARIKALADGIRSLEAAINEGARHARINVLETAMSGTRIEIGNAVLHLTAPVEYATFRLSGDEVRFSPYSERS